MDTRAQPGGISGGSEGGRRARREQRGPVKDSVANLSLVVLVGTAGRALWLFPLLFGDYSKRGPGAGRGSNERGAYSCNIDAVKKIFVVKTGNGQ
jgi:hypothetical protein